LKGGGGWILTMQVIAGAKQAGISLLPRHVFEKQTIAELAEVAGEARVGVEAEQGMVSGEVPLLPFQRVFFEWELVRPEHFNQGVMLRLKAGVKTELLEAAVVGEVKEHDGSGMRRDRAEGGWRQASGGEQVG